MSFDPTVEIPTRDTSQGIGTEYRNGGSITPEDPKTNPITYVALVVALLALILSFVAITDDPKPAQVQVGEKVCIVRHVDGEDLARLFCQQ